jgi:hypothetical protein
MPVFRHATVRAPQHEELVAELARHLEPAPGQELPPQPEIYEEDVPEATRPLLRVTVIWGAWENFSEVERCRIILEAYDRARGREGMLRVSVAVGLTPHEARDLGLAMQRDSPRQSN